MSYIKQQLKIGLFGFGVVGEGIYHVLSDTPSLQAEILRVCIKHPEKKRNAPAELFTDKAEEILNNKDINLVVELIDNADEALHIVRTALQSGKSVISANKKMIANNLPELLRIRDEHNVSFLYEGAVCGSIPVIRNLEEYYDNDLLNSFSGIVNGSTNYILTKMNEEGIPFAQALEQAQEKGFAESDPTLDIEGIDAVNKLTIVLKHAYGIDKKPEDILYKGITRIHPLDVTFAKEKGYSIKLVANALQIEGSGIAAFVLPSFVGPESKLFGIKNEYNGVLIGSKLADEQFLYGKGAGRYPTSSAVLSDISALQYNYNYEYRKSTASAYDLSNELTLKVFISYPCNKAVDRVLFRKVDEVFENDERKYIIGDISLAQLKKAAWLEDKDYSIITFEKSARPSVPENRVIEQKRVEESIL